jgi:GxxExxY protein
MASRPSIDLYHGEISGQVIGAAIEVHRRLGPGMLESAYCTCLAHEFTRRKLAFQRERSFPLQYRDLIVDDAFRVDFIVADAVILEVKAVERLMPIHVAQALSYLRFAQKKVGLVINFHAEHIRDGMKRLVL